MILKLSACAEIGRHMTAIAEGTRNDSDVPAGYTYFGQFVDHDITFDKTLEGDEGDNRQRTKSRQLQTSVCA